MISTENQASSEAMVNSSQSMWYSTSKVVEQQNSDGLKSFPPEEAAGGDPL